MLARRGPVRRNPAAAHDAVRLHLENIGKIAADWDLELEGDRLHAVIDDVEVLVQAAADRPADREAQGAWWDRAGLRQESTIGEKDAGCVVADRPAVQQFPRLAIGVDPPAADNARIEEIEALVARPIDLPILFGDQHRLSLVDRDLRRADLHFDCHTVLRWWVCSELLME